VKRSEEECERRYVKKCEEARSGSTAHSAPPSEAPPQGPRGEETAAATAATAAGAMAAAAAAAMGAAAAAARAARAAATAAAAAAAAATAGACRRGARGTPVHSCRCEETLFTPPRTKEGRPEGHYRDDDDVGGLDAA